MSWDLTGTYFEHCPCDLVCPCTTSSTSKPADVERCTVVLAFNVQTGQVEGLDVAGRTVVVVVDAPRLMSDGGWKVGMYVDDGATDDQFASLGAVFTGQRGGIWAAMSPLIGTVLGAERAAITYADDGRTHRLTVGDTIDMEIEDWIPPGGEEVATLTGMTLFSPILTMATATRSRVDAFGIRMESPGQNGHAAPFSWAA
jgi:hypothetical protein